MGAVGTPEAAVAVGAAEVGGRGGAKAVGSKGGALEDGEEQEADDWSDGEQYGEGPIIYI